MVIGQHACLHSCFQPFTANISWPPFSTGGGCSLGGIQRLQWDRRVRRTSGEFFRSFQVKLQECQGVEEPEKKKETEGAHGGEPQNRGGQVSQVGIRRQCQAKELPVLPGWEPADRGEEAVLPPPGTEVWEAVCKSALDFLVDLYGVFFEWQGAGTIQLYKFITSVVLERVFEKNRSGNTLRKLSLNISQFC